jgi:hypothetical protein
MSLPANSQSGPAGSERFRLARLAREAALRVPGVAGTDPGPMGLFVTVSGGERLEGVVCAATKAGGYEVTLRLVCEVVALPALGEQVKAAVKRMATAAGIALDGVDVHVAALAGEEDQ